MAYPLAIVICALFFTITTSAQIQPGLKNNDVNKIDFSAFSEKLLTRMLSGNSHASIPKAVQRMNVLRQNVIAKGTCNPNVCFALDGGASVSDFEYIQQQDFASFVSAIISLDETAAYAAVQYGRRNTVISRLTNDENQFLVDIGDSSRRGRRPSSVEDGLQFCIGELQERNEDANKIVLFLNERSQISQSTVQLARETRSSPDAIAICAVGIGLSDQSFLNQLTGDPGNSLAIDDINPFLDNVDDIVKMICDST